MNKHIVIVTGTRADFGKLHPLAIALRDNNFKVDFFVTGMHTMKRYGLTKLEVHQVEGVRIFDFINQREGDPQDLILSKTVLGFSDFCYEHNPDLVIVHGDRVEAMACSLVCAINYIRCAHIEGGEVSGTIDEIFRHCNSKLASDHFVSSKKAKKRVKAMGETDSAIYIIGSPELDRHSQPTQLTLKDVQDHYNIPFSDYAIVMFHPVTSEIQTIGAQTQSLFDSLKKSGKNFVVISPNNDPGSNDIFKIIDSLPPQQFRQIASMRFLYFSELLRNAQALIGNSSAGVREAPFLGIASLNIGTRQNNRAQSTSIFNASAFNQQKINQFLYDNWGKNYTRDQSFGNGDSVKLFLKVLQNPNFWTRSLQKIFAE